MRHRPSPRPGLDPYPEGASRLGGRWERQLSGTEGELNTGMPHIPQIAPPHLACRNPQGCSPSLVKHLSLKYPRVKLLPCEHKLIHRIGYKMNTDKHSDYPGFGELVLTRPGQVPHGERVKSGM